jgi:hypothetical protein
LARYVALGAALAGVVVGAATFGSHPGKAVTRSVHHGTAGLKRTQRGADIRWRSKDTNVRIDASLDKLGGGAKAAIQSAFATWLGAEATLPRVHFDASEKASAQAAPDGKNTVLLAPITVAGHEHDLAITLTYSDEETGDIVEADIIINSEYPFRLLGNVSDTGAEDAQSESDSKTQVTTSGSQPSVSASRASCQNTSQAPTCAGGSYDLQNVATHEVGHFFGLGEDMDDPSATMYYCTSRCETHKRVLTNDDAVVMNVLYSATSDGSPGSAGGCGGARVAPRGALGEAAWLLAAAALGLSRRKRNRR